MGQLQFRPDFLSPQKVILALNPNRKILFNNTIISFFEQWVKGAFQIVTVFLREPLESGRHLRYDKEETSIIKTDGIRSDPII